MVRRVGHLFEQIISFENLMTAFRKAKKGAGGSESSNLFFFNLEIEIIQLQKELENGEYKPGEYRIFKVYEPKERVISVAPFRDRVVHHAVVSVLEPVFEKIFIFDSYATRKEKGTHKAVERAQNFMRKNEWFLKSDIKSYFASVDINMLIRIIKRKIKDVQVTELIEKILMNGSEDGKGLPIGNLTSQFFANVYLNIFDHFVKEKLKPNGYIRYMDDFVLFSQDREFLKNCRKKIEMFLKDSLGLCLKENATYINSNRNGLSFLGKRIYQGIIRIKRENLTRSLKKVHNRYRQFEKNIISEQKFTQSIASITGYLNEGNSFKLRKALI
ncbi:hypothetical protein KA996_06565 [bacterium]|nr:hypothetical protein [bacterium]